MTESDCPAWERAFLLSLKKMKTARTPSAMIAKGATNKRLIAKGATEKRLIVML